MKMRRTVISAAFIITLTMSAAKPFGQEFRPIPNPPRAMGLIRTLERAGQFKTFLELFGPDYKTLGFTLAGSDGSAAAAGPGGGPALYQTIFIPNDFAFASLPPGTLDALKRDPARRRAFLLAHVVPGRVMVADLSRQITDGTSRALRELKSRQGSVLAFTPGVRKGVNSPRINGRAGFGRFQDVTASDYLVVIHEVDAVLFGDGSV